MRVSFGAMVVGMLGLVYGLSAGWWSRSPRGERYGAIGAVGLLVAAIALIVIPWAMGVPW